MSSIVTGPDPSYLAALHVNPPQQPQNPLDNYAKILQIRQLMQNAPLQTQLLQQQVTEGQQNNAARQALNQAYASATTKDANGNVSFDPGKLQESLATGPAAYKTPEVLQGITAFKKSQIDLQNSMTELQQKGADMLGSAASAIKASNYDPTLAHSLLDTLPPSPQINQVRATIDGSPQQFRQMVDSAIQNSPAQQKLLNEQTVAGIRANTPEMQGMNAWLAANPGKTAADYQQHKIDMQTAADVTRETDPRVMRAKEQLAASEAAARQAVSDGDPVAAGKLLISGDVAPSQIISARRPEFAQKAFQAAHDLSNGQWNAQSSEANFKVANSPANTAFFGSAKSLTDKGGTLDQLAAAAQDIPQNQIPAFNSVADWEKAATGSGPIAKYASLALGVADDYSKVMGGGAGSDTSRAQALNLIGAKASPEQRAASIEGIRGAVASQTNSRIGNNPVLQRMYGSQSPAEGTVKTNSHGDKVVFRGGQWQLQ
jgi:hypothetical protein